MQESQAQQGKMATSSFQCKPPEEFTFTNPSEWRQRKQPFEGPRIVSGLAWKCSVEQVYALVYFTSDKTEDIVASFKFTDEKKNSYSDVLKAFENLIVLSKNVVYKTTTFFKGEQREGEGTGCEWTAGETKLLLDYYHQYFSQIGPMKKFRNKKLMFARIAANITEVTGIPKTGEQCCSRYKTVMRRKRSAAAHNNKSGNSPSDVPYEDEIAKIRWLDDSLEPEELRDSSGIVSMKRPQSQASTSQESSQDLTSQESVSQGRGSTTTKEPEPKKPKLSGSRMLEMQHFFEEMSKLQQEKEKKRTERENERLKRHQERQKYRERVREEKAKQHEEKMKLLSRFLGLEDV
ncbi:hypothetical protein HPB50_010144 [Hyalomma asiaticum]|uniref:Uncharacterized protein n=1 Tax=Hyalomma asiaticum TaxID=266040 RepID=A0ACB7SJI9_HYAAI|nr:hypothetical protein HPB50_010144 [Hyalomma asiaticum]